VDDWLLGDGHLDHFRRVVAHFIGELLEALVAEERFERLHRLLRGAFGCRLRLVRTAAIVTPLAPQESDIPYVTSLSSRSYDVNFYDVMLRDVTPLT
jgi:hypothetical protein